MKYIDIVFPKNNETSLINKARKLGYSGLIFVYEDSNIPREIPQVHDFEIFVGVLTNKLDSFRKSTKFKKNLLLSNDNSINIIKQRPNVLFDIEEEKDSMHQRKSGLNQVLCKLMKERNVSYGISINSILRSGNRAQLMGRIMQNVRLCQKYKVNIVVGSFASSSNEMRNPDDIESLLRLFGVKSTKTCFEIKKGY